jgi:predicted secreted protein
MKHVLYLLLVAAFVLSACAAPTPEPTPAIDPAGSTMPALTDPAQPISVKAGEVFMIVVESNPSTGYHWEIVGESNGIEMVAREYTAAEPVIPGSGGVEVWTLKAVASGEVTLVFGNYPPGEGTAYEQEVQFTISVQ